MSCRHAAVAEVGQTTKYVHIVGASGHRHHELETGLKSRRHHADLDTTMRRVSKLACMRDEQLSLPVGCVSYRGRWQRRDL